MPHEREHYVDGAWVEPLEPTLLDVVDPSTGAPFAKIALGGRKDVYRAVAAARTAFNAYSRTSRIERLELLKAISVEFVKRRNDIAEAISREMGCPLHHARSSQASPDILNSMIEVLEKYEFEHLERTFLIRREPIGVVGMITPWNWPVGQILGKVAPALAAGCTMVLKPSEVSPMSAIVFAEAMHAAGVPRGVFNLVQGDGPIVGNAMSAHPGIDMMSFTGSTRAGIEVAKSAASTVKRVSQELGGKSPNILLPDAHFEDAVAKGVSKVMFNSGQACSAPTRMLVPFERHAKAMEIAKVVAEKLMVGDPKDPATDLGPVANEAQFRKVQQLIQAGIDEGAELVTGGVGRPQHIEAGYFVRPTIFANVRNDMTIAREEIFGPVLSILPYRDEEEAISIANDTEYGLAAYVQSADIARARKIALRLRAGTIHINYPPYESAAPVGGYKHSGNGRENGKIGLEEFTEVKSIRGYGNLI